MIRTQAKGLLLSIVLVIASFCFFACDESKIGVDSVKFETPGISMFVGEELSPAVKVLPSVATDRSYTKRNSIMCRILPSPYSFDRYHNGNAPQTFALRTERKPERTSDH